ncbi:hypothetical protein [Corynebacterium hadale]|uniref:hypothetical protein n=1 Tax=Corynebacterium hadale TaxID=2026255 RepID=UPI0010564572|nr:hypothetical protein [Corynebacterium hadale]
MDIAGVAVKSFFSMVEKIVGFSITAICNRDNVNLFSIRGEVGETARRRYIQVILENRGKNVVTVGPLLMVSKGLGGRPYSLESLDYNYFPRRNDGNQIGVKPYDFLRAAVPYHVIIEAAIQLGVPLDDLRFIVRVNKSSRQCRLPKREAEIIRRYNVYDADL